MNKKILMVCLSLLILLIFSPVAVFADCEINIENLTGEKIYYRLYWVDHPFDDVLPVHMAGGELVSFEDITPGEKYRAGRYCFFVRTKSLEEEIFVEFSIQENVPKILLSISFDEIKVTKIINS